MYTYAFHQWLSFFYIYSFFGWIFESCYVSIKSRRLVQPGLSAASDAPPLRHRRRNDALGVPPSPGQHSGRLPGRHHSRQHSGICHRIRHGAAFQDEILGLQPSALPDQRLRQPGILPDLGTSDHSADGMGAPAHLGLRPGPVSLDRISGAGGSHRRVCAGRGAVHQRGAGSGPARWRP